MGKRGPKPKPDHKHGSRGGFTMHQQRGTDPCFPCRHADYMWRQNHRAEGKCATGLGWPLLPAREAAADGN